MKHISAFYDQEEIVSHYFAWLPKRSSFSGKIIWLSHYVLVTYRWITPDQSPPVFNTLLYTPYEYTVYLLKKSPKSA